MSLTGEEDELSGSKMADSEELLDAKEEDEDEDIADTDQDADGKCAPAEMCEDEPNFSAICSFFGKFGTQLGLTYTMEELKLWLEDDDESKWRDFDTWPRLALYLVLISFLLF